MTGNEIERSAAEVVDGEVMAAPDPTVVKGEIIAELCWAMGFDPARVTRIDLDPRWGIVTVERVRHRNGRPYLDVENNRVAKDDVRLSVDWSTYKARENRGDLRQQAVVTEAP